MTSMTSMTSILELLNLHEHGNNFVFNPVFVSSSHTRKSSKQKPLARHARTNSTAENFSA